MSGSHHGHGTDDGFVSSTGADIQHKKVIAVGVVSLVSFAISAVIAARMWSHHQDTFVKETGGHRAAAYIGQPEIGIVEQIHYDADHRVDDWKAATKKRLGSYGWVDKSKNQVHVPVEKGMDLVIEEAAKAPIPGAPTP